MTIKGIHALFNSTKPEEARAFIRDKLGLPFTDSGGGWLMFGMPEGDIGVHPATHGEHAISFYTDDLDATMTQLTQRGVELKSVTEEEWGNWTEFELPGSGPVMLYQAKYERSFSHG